MSLTAALQGFATSYSARRDREERAAWRERMDADQRRQRAPGVTPESPALSYADIDPDAKSSDPLMWGLVEAADELQMKPEEMLTYVSYETAGTFDPRKKGPRTQWGQHEGLIQFGEDQQKQYGVDWNDPVGSQVGRDGAIVRYFRDRGWKPGMSGLDGYSIINAGAPGRYNASDANNGGAPGTVRDKYEQQMAGHRAKARAILSRLYGAQSADVGIKEEPAPEPQTWRFFRQLGEAQ